jgi:hypothetical protein
VSSRSSGTGSAVTGIGSGEGFCYTIAVRKLVFALLVATCAATLAPAPAPAAHQCGLPHARTLWIDFADGSTPYWRTFARAGNVVAAANFIFPPRIRALGAKTVYMDVNFRHRIGTPTKPEDPALVEERANRIYDYAAAAMQCATPVIALNELFGARTTTPWSPSNARYRANVLLYMRTLAARGARPALLISSRAYTGGEAGDWWREAARYGDLIREVYFPAPAIHRQGPVLGSRSLRTYFRDAALNLLLAGIPQSRVGLMLGFQTGAGIGGREGLQPREAWFRVVKWQALAARRVSRELGLASIWSWGWAAWADREKDPDKLPAACVWLWARDPQLCNGPKAAGPGFNASLTEGQIDLPRGVQCTLDGRRRMSTAALRGLATLTGDREVAFSALYARLVESAEAPVSYGQILAAERAIVAARFGGSFSGYRAALARARATVSVARGVIGDELRRAAIKARLRVGYPSPEDVQSYYASYGATQAREVVASPAPWWLNGRRRGLALASSAPAALFKLVPGRRASLWTPGGMIRVRALGPVRLLSSFPLARAQPAIVAALRDIARASVFTRWTVVRQRRASRRLACLRDDLPGIAAVELSDYLPFLDLA